jgi:hypothetical protein
MPDGDIQYGNGPLMLGTITAYQLFYGSVYDSDTASVDTLTYFIKNLGGSSYYNIETTYRDKNCINLRNSLNFGGNSFLRTSKTAIDEDFAISAIKKNIDNGVVPININGLYSFIFDGRFSFDKMGSGWFLFL